LAITQILTTFFNFWIKIFVMIDISVGVRKLYIFMATKSANGRKWGQI